MKPTNKFAEKPIVMEMLDEARFTKNILGKPRKAMKICNKILEIDPENRDALLVKAGGLQELNNLSEALTLIQAIIEKWPQDWEAYYLAAGNHFSQNKDQEALEMIDKSLERKETFDNIISKAQMLCIWGKEYKSWLDKARRIDEKRLENFMKHYWVGNMDELKISFWDILKAKIHFQ